MQSILCADDAVDLILETGMNVDLTPFFTEYESLVAQTDTLFLRVANAYPGAVTCAQGCSDCCHAVFDISLVEALYLNAKFQTLDADVRNTVLLEADKADRKAYVLKKRAYNEAAVESQEHVLAKAAHERVRCPLLDTSDRCLLYEYRPITCRVYGIPVEIGGKSHTCGLSGFEPGKPYPTVKLERIQDRLVALSEAVLDAVGSPYQDFRLMHVPVSSALLTVYSDEFFGLSTSACAPGSEGAVDA